MPILKKTVQKLTKITIQTQIKSLKKLPGLVFFGLVFSYSVPITFASDKPVQSANALINNPSPYLAMHGQDPVDWQLWQNSTLQKAQQQNKLILISSGYFSCHWCHVMQHENYQDAATAKFLNQHFIAVKIDRELTPDLDQYLIQFAQKASGHAGWPQHVILTPEGYPFFAFVYQPNAQFKQTLQKIVQFWQDEPQKIRSAAQKAIKPTPITPASKITLNAEQFEQRFFYQLNAQIDDLSGGLKSTAKFPNSPILNALLNYPKLPSNIQEWLLHTLDQMQSQHLFDHINGGFYRYTVDPEWQTPHFEKMLYTQAELAKIYFQAGQKFKRKDYTQTALTTLAYAEKHLYNSNTKLFLGSQSANDKFNVEGGDYLWSREALKVRLSPEAYKIAKLEWHLNQSAPYEAGWLPKPTSSHWPEIQQKLTSSPKQIPTDSKSIVGWNGLMLSAYAMAFQTATTDDAKQHAHKFATQLASILTKTLLAEAPPRAFGRGNQEMGRANLQDYAFVLQGVRDWQTAYPTTQNKHLIQTLQRLAEQKFLTPQGWHYSDAPLLPGQTGRWTMEDAAIPSPTAILACTHTKTLAHSQAEIARYPLAYASYSQALQCINP